MHVQDQKRGVHRAPPVNIQVSRAAAPPPQAVPKPVVPPVVSAPRQSPRMPLYGEERYSGVNGRVFRYEPYTAEHDNYMHQHKLYENCSAGIPERYSRHRLFVCLCV